MTEKKKNIGAEVREEWLRHKEAVQKELESIESWLRGEQEIQI